MAKPKFEKRNPRLVKRGDIVINDAGGDEVVRNVSIIIHLANGNDMVVRGDDEVQVQVSPALDPEIEAAVQNNPV